EVVAVPADDELPALEVLRGRGTTPGVEDPDEIVGVERAVGEVAHDPFVGDRIPDRHPVVPVCLGHEATLSRFGSTAGPGAGVASPASSSTSPIPWPARRPGMARASSERTPPGSRWIAVSGRGVSGRRRASAAAARPPAFPGGAGA